jgi:hypothetical protein
MMLAQFAEEKFMRTGIQFGGLVVAAICVATLVDTALGQDAPLMKVLDQFTASDVPAVGPQEVPSGVRTWWDPATQPDSVSPGLPGNGLAQHPFLFAGEGLNTLFVVRDGKVIWTYSSGVGGEIDDVWMLSNGHILYSRLNFLEEVTPQKKVVWHFDAPKGTEIHTCQPIGLDKVLFVENGLPPKAIIMNKMTDEVVMEHELPAPSLTDPKSVHGQFRRFRMTAAGTFLAAHLTMNKVVEYDKDFKPIWSYDIGLPWAAVRLKNGNTLIDGEKERVVREVTPKGETVWEFKQSDLPAGVVQRNNQTADRLADGDTIICSSISGAKGVDVIKTAQVVEVSADKKVVWALQDWKDFGPGTTVQILDEPGVPENPGELQR